MNKIFSILLLCAGTSAFAQQTTTSQPDTCAHLNEVVVTGVTGTARIREIAAPVSVVSNATLRAHQSTNIIDAISHQPGISQVTTGSGISKPVIRGLGYNRVLVVNDGVRQEGQQWGNRQTGYQKGVLQIRHIFLLFNSFVPVCKDKKLFGISIAYCEKHESYGYKVTL